MVTIVEPLAGFSKEATLDAFKTEQKAEMDESQALLQQIADNTDTLEVSIDNLELHTDTLEALQQATTDAVDALKTQSLTEDNETQTKLDTINTTLTDEDFASETTLAAFKAEQKAESDATQVKLDTINSTLTSEDFASEATLAAFKAEAKAESDATQTLLQTEFDETQTKLDTINNTLTNEDFAQDATAAIRSNRFASLLKYEAEIGEELRSDEPTATDDRYHGRATDGTATSAASWEVVRFYKTGINITRVRYRTGVAWDSRTAGW